MLSFWRLAKRKGANGEGPSSGHYKVGREIRIIAPDLEQSARRVVEKNSVALTILGDVKTACSRDNRGQSIPAALVGAPSDTLDHGGCPHKYDHVLDAPPRLYNFVVDEKYFYEEIEKHYPEIT